MRGVVRYHSRAILGLAVSGSTFHIAKALGSCLDQAADEVFSPGYYVYMRPFSMFAVLYVVGDVLSSRPEVHCIASAAGPKMVVEWGGERSALRLSTATVDSATNCARLPFHPSRTQSLTTRPDSHSPRDCNFGGRASSETARGPFLPKSGRGLSHLLLYA